MTSLELSLNNPGDLRPGGGVTYEGEVVPSSNPGFRQFTDLFLGFRAMASDLYHYIVHSGYDTIEKIINVYAPAGDGANNPDSYINFVVKNSGIPKDQVLTKDDFSSSYLGLEEPNMLKIIRAMATDEDGVKPNETEMLKGYDLFLKDEGLPS